MDILSLGEKIKRLRKEKGMTLKELAGDRVTAAQISHIERDKSHTSYELLEYLAERLDVSADYLLESKETQARNLGESLIIQSEVFLKCDELDKAEKSILKACRLSKEYNLIDIYGKCSSLLGDINVKRNSLTDAVSYYEKALHYFIKDTDARSMFRCYINIGKIHLKEKLYKIAVLKFKLANDVIEDMEFEKHKEDYKELYSGMAYCHMKLGDNDICMDYIEKIDEITKRYDSKQELESNILKANNLFSLGRLEDSKIYFKKALSLLNKDENKSQVADIYITISEVCKDVGDIDRMLEYSQKVYDIKKDDKDEYMLRSLQSIVESYIIKKEYGLAKEYCKLGLSTSIKNKDRLNECKILKLYAKIHQELKDIDLCIQYLTKCLEIAREIDNKKLVGDIYISLAEIYSSSSKEKELEFYQKGASVYKSLETI